MIRRNFLKFATLFSVTFSTKAIATEQTSGEDQFINNVMDSMKRLSFWRSMGTVVDEVTIDPLNPFNAEHPSWPGDSRKFILINTRQDTRIFFTEGLSDVSSLDDRYKNRNGLELELFLETDEQLSTIQSGWAANILLEVSKAVVNHGAVREKLKELKFLIVQIDMEGAPDEWSLSSNNGNIGVFIGLARVDFPQSILLQKTFFTPTCIKLMRPAELEYAIEFGTAGREKLAQLYSSPDGLGNISNLSRSSVI